MQPILKPEKQRFANPNSQLFIIMIKCMETQNPHHFSAFKHTRTLPKQPWNMMLLMRLLLFPCFWCVKISLKREALVKCNIVINSAFSQNKPKTRSSRQQLKNRIIIAPRKQRYNAKLSSNSAILSMSQPLTTGLKHDAVDKNNVFHGFVMGQNQLETRSSRQI